MINPRISADWSTTKPIAALSCTPSVQEVHSKAEGTKPIAAFSCTLSIQEVHTKAEVVQLTPGLPGLGVIFYCHA